MALSRFAVEFVREPDAHIGYIWGVLTMGQILSLPMIARRSGVLGLGLEPAAGGRPKRTDGLDRRRCRRRVRLRGRIRAEGPLSVEAVMAEANAAYYAAGPVLGAEGDFITAPEISQVFGEIIGLWLAVVWQGMGAPGRVILAECGPGRGTLMADALRALAPVPAFRDALELHLVETSPALRARQRDALGDAVTAWHDDLGGLPDDAPLLLVGNEFLDALPVRQVVRRGASWRLRRVGLTPDEGGFCFVEGETVPADDVAESVRHGAPEGAIAESHPAAAPSWPISAAASAARAGPPC